MRGGWFLAPDVTRRLIVWRFIRVAKQLDYKEFAIGGRGALFSPVWTRFQLVRYYDAKTHRLPPLCAIRQYHVVGYVEESGP